MKKAVSVLLIIATILSCNNSDERKTTVSVAVKLISSPASDSCAEPFLFTGRNEVTYLSWIEKRGKQSTLFFSTLSDEKWSDPKKISSGINWFVNWADYPVISGNGDNNLLAHYLEKSDGYRYGDAIQLALHDG